MEPRAGDCQRGFTSRAMASCIIRPIPDGFRDMRAKDVGTAGKIGNRPRYAQDAMHRLILSITQDEAALRLGVNV